MTSSKDSRMATPNSRFLFIVCGLTIWITQTMFFTNVSHAGDRLMSVPLGFRTQAVNKVKASTPVLPGKEIREKSSPPDLIVQAKISNEKSNALHEQASVIIPNLIGIAKASATFQIGKSGLVIGEIIEKNHETIPPGNVMGQIPVSGSEVKLESPVIIIISSGPSIGSFTKNDNKKVRSVKHSTPQKPGKLQWENKSLGEVLDEVETFSGIKFRVPSYLKEENVNMEVHAETWEAVIKKLLRGYSSVEMLNSEGHLVSVWVMRDKKAGNATYMSASRETKAVNRSLHTGRETNGKVTPNKLEEEEKKINSDRSEHPVLYSKLENLKTWPSNRPLPSSIYEDVDLKSFLSANGIESPNNLSEPKNIKQLKQAARKELLLMKMRARADKRKIKK